MHAPSGPCQVCGGCPHLLGAWAAEGGQVGDRGVGGGGSGLLVPGEEGEGGA